MIRRSDEPTITQLAVGAADAAAMMGVSPRNWWRWHAAGRTPPSFKVGGRRLWRVSDLRAWAESGFPRRTETTVVDTLTR